MNNAVTCSGLLSSCVLYDNRVVKEIVSILVFGPGVLGQWRFERNCFIIGPWSLVCSPCGVGGLGYLTILALYTQRDIVL